MFPSPRAQRVWQLCPGAAAGQARTLLALMNTREVLIIGRRCIALTLAAAGLSARPAVGAVGDEGQRTRFSGMASIWSGASPELSCGSLQPEKQN